MTALISPPKLVTGFSYTDEQDGYEKWVFPSFDYLTFWDSDAEQRCVHAFSNQSSRLVPLEKRKPVTTTVETVEEAAGMRRLRNEFQHYLPPSNAYMIYSYQKRREYLLKNEVFDAIKTCNEWKKMSKEEKLSYDNELQRRKIKYDEELRIYHETHCQKAYQVDLSDLFIPSAKLRLNNDDSQFRNLYVTEEGCEDVDISESRFFTYIPNQVVEKLKQYMRLEKEILPHLEFYPSLMNY